VFDHGNSKGKFGDAATNHPKSKKVYRMMFMKSTKYTNTNQKIAGKKNTCKLGVFSKTHASIPYNLAIAGFMRF